MEMATGRRWGPSKPYSTCFTGARPSPSVRPPNSRLSAQSITRTDLAVRTKGVARPFGIAPFDRQRRGGFNAAGVEAPTRAQKLRNAAGFQIEMAPIDVRRRYIACASPALRRAAEGLDGFLQIADAPRPSSRVNAARRARRGLGRAFHSACPPDRPGWNSQCDIRGSASDRAALRRRRPRQFRPAYPIEGSVPYSSLLGRKGRSASERDIPERRPSITSLATGAAEPDVPKSGSVRSFQSPSCPHPICPFRLPTLISRAAHPWRTA
jgi:hypothetical protein